MLSDIERKIYFIFRNTMWKHTPTVEEICRLTGTPKQPNFPLTTAIEAGQAVFNGPVIVMDGGSILNKRVESHIGDVTGGIINIASENVSANVNYQVDTPQPVDNAAEELLRILQEYLAADTLKVAERMVIGATSEAKKTEKDQSKIRGLVNVLEPLLKTSSLIPEAMVAFDKWDETSWCLLREAKMPLFFANQTANQTTTNYRECP